MIRVLIVDDHPMFRAGAATALGAEPDIEVIGEAATAAEAIEASRLHNPDVLLMDIRLSGGVNGVELARQLREESPDTKVVVLTNYSNEPYIRAMMEIGVEAYIIKDTPPHEVIDAIRMVMAGRTVFSAKITETVVKGYLGASSDASIIGPERVTEREREVLRSLVDGASNDEIAGQLHLSVGTVQYHLTNLYGKLGVRNRQEAVIKAAREGLIIIDE